jgi:hypothetical protein
LSLQVSYPSFKASCPAAPRLNAHIRCGNCDDIYQNNCENAHIYLLFSPQKGITLYRNGDQPSITEELFPLSLSTAPAWSWGCDGHRAICMIADFLLANDNDPAIAAVNNLLGGVSLVRSLRWADCAKGYCGAALWVRRR